MKFKYLITESEKPAYTLKFFDSENKYVNQITSSLKTINGVLKKYATYLSTWNFKSTTRMFEYLTNDYMTLPMYTLKVYDANDNEVYSSKYSEYIKKYYGVEKIFDMTKSTFNDKWDYEHKSEDIDNCALILGNSKMFVELFGAKRVKELLDTYKEFKK